MRRRPPPRRNRLVVYIKKKERVKKIISTAQSVAVCSQKLRISLVARNRRIIRSANVIVIQRSHNPRVRNRHFATTCTKPIYYRFTSDFVFVCAKLSRGRGFSCYQHAAISFPNRRLKTAFGISYTLLYTTITIQSVSHISKIMYRLYRYMRVYACVSVYPFKHTCVLNTHVIL